MDSKRVTHVVEAARTDPTIRRELRELVRLARKIEAIGKAEERKLKSLSTAELMARMQSDAGLGSESKKRITEIAARKRKLAEHLASLMPMPSTYSSDLADWLIENHKELVARLPQRKWWEVLLGRD